MEKFTQSDSKGNTIHLYVYEPEAKPKGVVQIIHGASEHFARYGLFADFLSKNGFAVVGCDILGHGLSTSTTDYVHFADKDGDRVAFESVLLVKDYIQKTYPKQKYYVLGHSMGEFLARKLVMDYPEFYEKAIWSGSTYVSGIMSSIGIALTTMIGFFKGPKYVSKMIQNMAIDANPRKARKDGLIHDLNEEWLSRDKEIQDYYHNSPICGQPFTVSANRDMFRWLKYVNKTKNFAKIKRDLPIFIISGAKDPFSNYGEKIYYLYNLMLKLGFTNVQMKLYDENRHEILNELDKAIVYADVLNFLKK